MTFPPCLNWWSPSLLFPCTNSQKAITTLYQLPKGHNNSKAIWLLFSDTWVPPWSHLHHTFGDHFQKWNQTSARFLDSQCHANCLPPTHPMPHLLFWPRPKELDYKTPKTWQSEYQPVKFWHRLQGILHGISWKEGRRNRSTAAATVTCPILVLFTSKATPESSDRVGKHSVGAEGHLDTHHFLLTRL